MTSWEDSKPWYNECVGVKGHYYHQSLILENAKRLLHLNKGKSILDLGCGQGVLARSLPPDVEYVGVDLSPSLIAEAKRMGQGTFLIADASKPLPIEKKDFDAACLILSLQNMEDGEKAVATALSHVRKGGKLLIVLNHPCFRIPRQSEWGIDSERKLQYRRVNRYMSEEKIPIQMNPGKGKQSSTTYSFHHPLSTYVEWLTKSGGALVALEEWCSDKKSEGSKAKMEDRARKEFPLFLAILAVKGSPKSS